MNMQIKSRAIVCAPVFALLWVMLMPVSASGDSSAVEMTLARLGLGSDATDAEIVQLLDEPQKRLAAMRMIRYRKISSAIPDLIAIVEEDNTAALFFDKLWAAETLCDLGNKEWMGIIRELSTDSGAPVKLTDSNRARIAGLLARGGDYSQFDVVKRCVSDEKKTTRSAAIWALANFDSKTDETAVQAGTLLEAAAVSDGDPFLRDVAIWSLERIAEVRPEMTPRVIRALDANLDSSDKRLRAACARNREIYRLKMMTDEEVIRLLDEPRKLLTALSLIKERKMTVATPRLLEIVENESGQSYARLSAAKALLGLGNRQWIEPMKVISADPNIPMPRRLAISGLLAQVGDYTQFEFVGRGLESGDSGIRREA